MGKGGPKNIGETSRGGRKISPVSKFYPCWIWKKTFFSPSGREKACMIWAYIFKKGEMENGNGMRISVSL